MDLRYTHELLGHQKFRDRANLHLYGAECASKHWQPGRQPVQVGRTRSGKGIAYGSGWESNPPGPLLQHPSSGFEDRGAHRDSTTPTYSHRILAFSGLVKRFDSRLNLSRIWIELCHRFGLEPQKQAARSLNYKVHHEDTKARRSWNVLVHGGLVDQFCCLTAANARGLPGAHAFVSSWAPGCSPEWCHRRPGSPWVPSTRRSRRCRRRWLRPAGPRSA